MGRFIKRYALEIYTVISMGLLLAGALMDNLSIIQKFVMVFTFLFILHEWEEMHYPGGFTKLISQMIGVEVTDETNRASRIPAGILLLLFTITPFVLKDCVVAVLIIASLGILEGFVHLMAIRLFHLKKLYSPGLITAELELLVSIALIVWLERNNLASATDYVLGFVIMFVCFVIMQKTITMMVGIKYSDVPDRLRKQWSSPKK